MYLLLCLNAINSKVLLIYLNVTRFVACFCEHGSSRNTFQVAAVTLFWK